MSRKRRGLLLYGYKGRRVGSVVDGVMQVTAHSDRGHLLTRPPGPGWAFDNKVIQDARHLGAREIEVKDKSTGRVYRVSMDQFWGWCIPFNFGYGVQVVLPLAKWECEGPAVQPALWEGT